MPVRTVLVLLSLALAAFCHADNEYTPAARERVVLVHTTQQRTMNGDFQVLDQSALRYLSPTERHPSGEWRLESVYRGIRSGLWGLEGKKAGSAMQMVERWLQANPQSVAAHNAKSILYLEQAQSARGTGYADTVTEQGWQGFREGVRKAMDVLLRAEKLPNRDPELFVNELRAGRAMELGAAEMQAIFQRGVALAPDYQPLYDAYAEYLLPRWSGEAEDVRLFAEYAADKITSSGGDIRYALIAQYVHEREKEGVFKVHKFSIQRVEKGMAELERQYPNPSYTYNVLALFYRTLRDQERASKVVDRLPKTFDFETKTLWKDKGAFDEFRAWAAGNANLKGKTYLDQLFNDGTDAEILAYVATAPDLNARDANGNTLIDFAVAKRKEHIAKLLVSKGADILTSSPHGTPFHWACFYGMTGLIELGLSKGANPRMPITAQNWLPIHYAAIGESTDALAMLIKAAPDTVNARTEQGGTALMAAVEKKNANAARMLLAAKANPADATPDGRTALHMAASLGDINVVKGFIESKVDLSPTARNGDTPLREAKAKGHTEVVRLLEQHGAK